MDKRIKLWSSLSVATLVGAGALAGCERRPDGGEPPVDPVAETRSEAPASSQPDEPRSASPVAGEGEGEGEGEGGSDADPATDDVAFATQLELIRGHLWVGMELFRAGHLEQARTHMKHPEDEIYAGLKPAFAARDVEPFDQVLTDLAEAVQSDAEAAQVERAYGALQERLDRARATASLSPAEHLLVAARLVRTAGEEYAMGVDEQGDVVNPHEYQDALGFVTVAEALVEGVDSGGDETVSARLDEMGQLLDPLYAAWPGVVPPDTVEFDVSRLYGAASRIELAAHSLN